ncbi:MAG: TolC family protein [Phaeodactylibacter sp.]|nr:TolC family protein [Phaeodactylibacter sp.]MCB9276553.1 TolC family protein [Lewinellaceae bacterium]
MKSPDTFIQYVWYPCGSGGRAGLFRRIAALLPLAALALALAAQPAGQALTLSQVVGLAQQQSIAARQARTTLDTRYWEWRSFQANLRPQLLLTGNLPDFTRAYQEVIQPDGTIDFQSVTINNSGISLGISQPIAATGGSIFASTLLQRFDDFDRKNTLYSGRPLAVGFTQPFFTYNALKWDKRIEPVRYRESQQLYLREREDINYRTAGLFFDLLLAQVNLEMANSNLSSNDTLYKIALEREAVGKLSRNDLLQLQLGVLTARKDAAAARQGLETAWLALRAYAGLTADTPASLSIPGGIPEQEADEEIALEQAWANRPEVSGFERRRLEAEQAVARARGETGIQATLEATFGWSNRASQAGDIYQKPQDYESVRLQFTVPIVDWGRASSRRETAEANRELVAAAIEQGRTNFDQEARTQVRLYNMLREQLGLSFEADSIARERYQIAKERFVLGNLSITDLNLALQEKDRARRDYISALREFWLSYYMLRSLTLFDFEKGQKLF